MEKYNNEAAGEAIYMGLDMHKKSWQLTIRTQHTELKKMNMPPHWKLLRKHIDEYGAQRVELVWSSPVLVEAEISYTSTEARCQHNVDSIRQNSSKKPFV
jgi:hypothetical protein